MYCIAEIISTLVTLVDMEITDDDEVYILQAPRSLKSSSVLSIDINLKAPKKLVLENREYIPVLNQDDQMKTLVGRLSEQYKSKTVEIKNIIKLREAVHVPVTPTVAVPEPYKVLPPDNLIKRHPIYGKTITKRKIGTAVEVMKEELDEQPKKKKKKKKDKSSEAN